MMTIALILLTIVGNAAIVRRRIQGRPLHGLTGGRAMFPPSLVGWTVRNAFSARFSRAFFASGFIGWLVFLGWMKETSGLFRSAPIWTAQAAVIVLPAPLLVWWLGAGRTE